LQAIEEAPVSDDKVVPFRPRPPSKSEVNVYTRMTRNWSPELRELMFPEHFRQQYKDERRR
jgi:hypothetical protein